MYYYPIFSLIMQDFFSLWMLVRRYGRNVLLIVFGALFLSIVLSVLRPLEYRSSARILVVPLQEQAFDPLSAARASEQLGNTLSQVMYTSFFQDQVLASGLANIDAARFSEEGAKRRQQWHKKLNTQVARETGMITIDMYDTKAGQAKALLTGIVEVLTETAWQYHGAGDHVVVRLVDAPLTTKHPVRPNVPMNMFLGLILGLLGAVLYLLWKAGERARGGRVPGFGGGITGGSRQGALYPMPSQVPVQPIVNTLEPAVVPPPQAYQFIHPDVYAQAGVHQYGGEVSAAEKAAPTSFLAQNYPHLSNFVREVNEETARVANAG